ncbi:MAG: hypothetical protein AB7K09_06625 [Planctomycetota bacterium]
MNPFRIAPRIAVALIALLAIAPAVALAQPGDWKKLGEKKVGFGVDRDVIDVNEDALFRKIRLRVQDSDIEIVDLKVHFRNGDTEDVAVREKLKDGSMTRIIDLPGAVRHIEKVTLIYRTDGPPRPRARATVQLFGLKEDLRPDPTPQPDPPASDPPAPEGWAKLGEKKVGFGVDRDVIDLDASERRYNSIRLRVLGNSIDVYDLTVHFENGESHDVEVRQHLDEGGMTRAIDLPGAMRNLQKITMINRTDGRLREGRATIQVFGHKRDDIEGWEVLGKKRVGFGQDKDVITVTGARGDFTKVAVLVEENDIEVTAMKISFRNGETFDVPLRETFKAGTRSREIDLPGGDRIIQAVGFNYTTEGRPRDGFAHITLLGKAGVNPGVQPPDTGDRWEKIGDRNVDFRGDNDIIRVDSEKGPFRQIRFRVTGNNIQIGDIEVHFRVGKQDVQVRALVKDGEDSGVIDLTGDNRHITEIHLKYRTVGRAREGKANVEVWAR